MRVSWVLSLLSVGCGAGSLSPAALPELEQAANPAAAEVVEEPLGPGAITELVAGVAHVCALHDTGHVSCWGDDSLEQLGGEREGEDRAVVLTSAVDVIQLAAGSDHTCAVQRDGDVVCWGMGRAVERVDISDATMVACGTGYSCARRSDGTVWCWGRGELAGLDLDATPRAVEQLEGVAAVAAGTRGMFALLEDGSVMSSRDSSFGTYPNTPIMHSLVNSLGGPCAQSNEGDRMCLGSRSDRLPRQMLVVSGARHRCAVFDGSAYCAGDNLLGGVGVEGSLSVIDYTRVSLDGEVSRVVAGDGFSCALGTDGGVRCWGEGAAGQLGTRGETPGRVMDVSNVVSVSTSGAVLEDGSVRTWSRDAGDLAGLSNVSRISLADQRGCAIVAGGRVSCWWVSEGDVRAVRGVSDAVALSVGRDNACVLLGDSTVRCLRGGRAARPRGVNRAQAVGCTSNECCVANEGGAVACWSPEYIVQGCSDCAHSEIPLTDLAGLDDVVELATTPARVCARRSDGRVFCWGAWMSGGRGQERGVPTLVVGAENMAQIAGLGGVTEGGALRYFDGPAPGAARAIRNAVELADDECARLSDGTVTCWGEPRWYDAATFLPKAFPIQVVIAPREVEGAEIPN
jgi:hypothetical protein